MLRIIHFSDFHLNKKNLEDWDYFLKDKLIEKLLEINAEKKIDLILMTGDLVDKGGIDFKVPEGSPKEHSKTYEAFKIFEKSIIEPILKELNLARERFLIIPGNHDLDQSIEPEFMELGLQALLKTEDAVNSFIRERRNGNFQGIERIRAFKSFERDFYTGIADCQLSSFDSLFKIDISGETIGVACFNSSWRCFDSKKDKGLILVGEMQVANAVKHLKGCQTKIALLHHPFDWVNPVDQAVSKHLQKEFDLMFLGHVHEGQTIVQTGFTSSLFLNVAPGALTDIRTDSKRFSNGFTLVEYSKGNKRVNCTYFRYHHNNNTFVLNTELGENGKYEFEIPQHGRLSQIKLAQEHLKVIKEVHYELMNENLISKDAEFGPKSVNEAFVLPKIISSAREIEDDDETKEDLIEGLSLQEIVIYETDLLLFGVKESGKTTLLNKLVHEYVDRFEFTKVIPVYVDFLEIGNREIPTCIKSYLSCSTEDLNSLLQNRDIVLLIDNFQWDKLEFAYQVKKLELFKEAHKANNKGKRIKIIATASNEIVGVAPSDFDIPKTFNFDVFYIQSLKVSHIKGLISKWVKKNSDDDVDKKLEKIVESFRSFALPKTPMSVSLFLWTIESKSKKPINKSALLEMFVEILLDKVQSDAIYRETFDFKNKLQVLAHVASEMLDKGEANYSLLKSELLSIVDIYLKDKVGFEFDNEKVVNYFIKTGIFTKFNKNHIKFRFNCFFHFFLAKRMEFHDEFREYVLDEKRYFDFVEEIDYYSGLVRSDKKLLELVHERAAGEFKKYLSLLEKIDFDKHFTAEKSAVKDVRIDDLKSSRPSVIQVEKKIDKELEEIPVREEILQKQSRKTTERVLLIAANTLRNSEGVEDLALKRKVYNDLIGNVLIFTIMYQYSMVKYYLKHNCFPHFIPKNYNVNLVLRNVPYHIQLGMSDQISSKKLAPVILSKIKQDEAGDSITKSDLEKFFSVFFYADIQGQNYPKYLKEFVKKLKNNAVRDFSLYKLTEYFFNRSKPDSESEKYYLDILATLKIKTQGLHGRLKDTIRKHLLIDKVKDTKKE